MATDHDSILEFGTALLAVRAMHGWRQIDLARELEVSVGAVRRWEQTGALPTWETLKTVLAVTGLTGPYFVTPADDAPRPPARVEMLGGVGAGVDDLREQLTEHDVRLGELQGDVERALGYVLDVTAALGSVDHRRQRLEEMMTTTKQNAERLDRI